MPTSLPTSLPTNLWDWNDPSTQMWLVGAGALLVLLLIFRRWWRRWRESIAIAQRRADLRKHYGALQMQQAEVERLAARIIATSSTPTIAGFAIIRQIEAVITDGHQSPNKAVEVLKALAAEKGANAVINLNGQRLASGKCSASGDAVLVRAVDEPPR